MKNFKMVLVSLFAGVLFVPSALALCDTEQSGKQASVQNTGSAIQYCDSIDNALRAATENAVVTLLDNFEFAGSNQVGRIEIEDKNITFNFGNFNGCCKRNK